VTRRSTLGLAAAGALLLPTAAACGIQPSGIVSLGALPSAVAGSAQPVIPAPGSTDYILYFYSKATGELTPVYRSGTQTVTENEVLDALVKGPTAAERAAGDYTELPIGLDAKANAQDEADAYALSTGLTQFGKAEFICTMQNYDEVGEVAIQSPGSGLIWNACTDTTGYYVQLTFSTSQASGSAVTGN
jgi:hypothetical protein